LKARPAKARQSSSRSRFARPAFDFDAGRSGPRTSRQKTSFQALIADRLRQSAHDFGGAGGCLAGLERLTTGLVKPAERRLDGPDFAGQRQGIRAGRCLLQVADGFH
jgi:hypothetical protein